MNDSPMLLADFYKISHREQYPPGTEYVYSTWIARSSYMEGVTHTVAFGFQRFVRKFLIEYFEENFFARPKDEVVAEYSRIIAATLGIKNPATLHIEELHDRGYLPLRIDALPEGTVVPLRVPQLTIENTDPRFFWLTNYIETLMSAELWQATTSATIAHEYRKLLDGYAQETNPEGAEFVQFQGHDFSMRGMGGVESAKVSGLGHLLNFVGTDTIPAILEAERYYDADVTEGLVGTSIPATEHSVMCAGGKDGELETYRRLVTDVYPTGFVSIVSDTWDLWHVIQTTIGKELRDTILARDGKVVIRPDSGTPVDIMCGMDPPGGPIITEAESKGVIELLWDAFGGTISSTGYKVLNPCIGAIYGDSITLDRARQICERLKRKGFASTNIVFGIGSYTYQYQTRDTFGHALKGTWVQINGEGMPIFKNPVTDTTGMKKSLTGRVRVYHDGSDLVVEDGLTDAPLPEQTLLKPIFLNGFTSLYQQSLGEIRERLAAAR